MEASSVPTLFPTLGCVPTPSSAPTVKLNILFVVVDELNLTVQESLKLNQLSLIWGHKVQLASQSHAEADFYNWSLNNDVVFIGAEVSYTQLVRKLTLNPIGIVNEATLVTQYLDLATNMRFTHSLTDISVTNTEHYITKQFCPGNVPLFGSPHTIRTLGGTMATGYTSLTTTMTFAGNGPGLIVLTTISTLNNGNPCPGRRVHLPWGYTGTPFNFNDLTSDGLSILRRSLEWAGGAEALLKVEPLPPDPIECLGLDGLYYC